jgi:hypothetical protein
VDEANSRLMFRESERIDAVFRPGRRGFGAEPIRPHLFVTNRNGRTAWSSSAARTISGEMYGIITTLQSGRGSNHAVAAPIVLVPARAFKEVQFG